MKYFNIYKKRANRFGNDYQSRIQGAREETFEHLLLKSLYRVDFEFEENSIPGILERYKQDETETLQYLLTRIDIKIPNGTILMIPDQDNNLKPWMIYYLENIKTSGYNRYIVLKMTHYLTWTARDGSKQQSWAYMYGQQNNMLKDEIRSRSRMDTIYAENLKLNFFIMPVTAKIQKDDYFIVGEGDLQEYYRVTGYDRQSTPGVEYVSIDPTYEYDLTPPPEQSETDLEEDFYWFNGGGEE